MNLSIISGLNKIQSWFSQAQATVAEEKLQAIPSVVKNKLERIIDQLPQPLSYVTTIESAIEASLKHWETEKEANRLVIIGSPMNEIPPLIRNSFPNEKLKAVKVIYPFEKLQVREKPARMAQELKSAIEATEKTKQSEKTIMVIPNLEQYFLRCIGGWDGIIWLREHLVNTPDCFWLLGCNHWSWKFLDYVCQINAYLEETVIIPRLDGDEIENWFKPVTETFLPELEAEHLSSFWDNLAFQSVGNIQVARQLWLKSIQMSVSEENKEELMNLKLINPSFPKLPLLSADDRYILHSLLLHGKMKRSSLALSLGEKEENIQARIQVLLRQELINQQQQELVVNPLVYPPIKQELNQNNFLIGEDA